MFDDGVGGRRKEFYNMRFDVVGDYQVGVKKKKVVIVSCEVAMSVVCVFGGCRSELSERGREI